MDTSKFVFSRDKQSISYSVHPNCLSIQELSYSWHYKGKWSTVALDRMETTISIHLKMFYSRQVNIYILHFYVFFMINHVIHSLLGYANDGGLYVCEQVPQVSKSELNLWKDMTYPCVVKKILRLFIGENELTDIEIEGAFYKIVCWIYIARVIVKLLYISYNHRNCCNFLSRVWVSW